MGKKNNSYTASYKLKVISFAEQFGNRAAQREFGILESNVRYWRKQKELLKNAKSDSTAFRGPKAGKSAYFMHPDFSAAKLEKKCANYASKYGKYQSLYCDFVLHCDLQTLRTQICRKCLRIKLNVFRPVQTLVDTSSSIFYKCTAIF
jgi:hypothetical protein